MITGLVTVRVAPVVIVHGPLPGSLKLIVFTLGSRFACASASANELAPEAFVFVTTNEAAPTACMGRLGRAKQNSNASAIPARNAFISLLPTDAYHSGDPVAKSFADGAAVPNGANAIITRYKISHKAILYGGVAKEAGMCDGVRMDIITCPECGAHDQAVRDGHNRSGSQRYRCRMCRRAFTPSPKEQGHDPTTPEQAVRLYLEGMSLRATGRILGVVHQSVANWVAEAAAHLPTAVSDATPSETVEVDELYTFVERKKGRPSS
jgi:transposase-like protein